MATSTASRCGGSLGKIEDTAHASGDVGVMALAVRQDTQVDFGADGDYVPLSVDGNGSMRVALSTSDAAIGSVTLGAGTAEIGKLAAGSAAIGSVTVSSIVAGTGATNVGKAEAASHSSGDVGVMMLGVRGDTTNYAPLTVDALGSLMTRAPTRHPIAYSTEVTVTAFVVLVDLSATGVFPHSETGYVMLDRIAFDVQFSTGTAVANIKIGVITRIDATDADVSWLYHAVPGAANSYDHRRTIEEFPGGLTFYTSGGNLQDAVTNITDANLSSIKTGVTLDSPVGSVTPAVGDVVMELGYDTDSFNITLSALYHTESTA
jgi:hypothetical protein